MPLRSSAPEIRAIIETDLTDDQVLPFLKTASLLVDENLVVVPAIGSPLLKEIETYLAAHLVTLWDPRALKAEADGTKFMYEGTATGQGLSSSRYGQMALTLDPTGILSTLNKTERLAWLARAVNETAVETII